MNKQQVVSTCGEEGKTSPNINKHTDYKHGDWPTQEGPTLKTLYAGIKKGNLQLAWIHWKRARTLIHTLDRRDPLPWWPQWLAEHKKEYL